MSFADHLPRTLREIAQIAGLDAALRIAALRGGSSVQFPRWVDEDHWLARAIGVDKARALCEHYTSGHTTQRVDIPLGPTGARAAQRRAIAGLIEEGVAGEEIARRMRIASRTVRRHKARDRRQGSLL